MKQKDPSLMSAVIVMSVIIAVSLTLTVLIITGVSVVIAPILLLLVAVYAAYSFFVYVRKFQQINNELYRLEDGFETLKKKMIDSSIDRINLLPENERERQLKQLSKGGSSVHVNRHGISNVNYNMRVMTQGMNQFIDYIDSQTYIDQLTRVGNKAAYKNAVKLCNESIERGDAKFGIGFFDMNGLRDINMKFGFEAGDRLLFDTADLLKKSFGPKNVFHVASDEFIVVMQDANYYDMRMLTSKFEDYVKKYNDGREEPLLSVARGCDAFRHDIEDSYRDVFARASKASKQDKHAFYDGTKKRREDKNAAYF